MYSSHRQTDISLEAFSRMKKTRQTRYKKVALNCISYNQGEISRSRKLASLSPKTHTQTNVRNYFVQPTGLPLRQSWQTFVQIGTVRIWPSSYLLYRYIAATCIWRTTYVLRTYLQGRKCHKVMQQVSKSHYNPTTKTAIVNTPMTRPLLLQSLLEFPYIHTYVRAYQGPLFTFQHSKLFIPKQSLMADKQKA